MSDWLIVALVPLALFGLWLWLGAVFDRIHDYHEHWKAEADLEDAQATKGTGSSLP